MATKKPIYHKRAQFKKAVEVYQGLGSYAYLIPPVCEGGRGIWRGRTFYTVRNWKDVTCKHCLRIKEKQDAKKTKNS